MKAYKVPLLIVLATLLLVVGVVLLYGNQETPGLEDPMVVEKSELYYRFHTNGTTITRVTAPGGEVVFEEGWSDANYSEYDYDLKKGDSVFASVVVPGKVQLPDEEVEGTAYVALKTSEIVELTKLYNSLERPNTPYPRPPFSGRVSTYMLEMVLKSAVDSTLDPVTLTVDPDFKLKENSTVADAFEKGLAPWQVVQGTPRYDFRNQYRWDFSCRLYRLSQEVDDSGPLNELRQKLPELELTRTADNSEVSPRKVDFRPGGVYAALDDIPCGIHEETANPTGSNTPEP